jgi:hypothetical protein
MALVLGTSELPEHAAGWPLGAALHGSRLRLRDKPSTHRGMTTVAVARFISMFIARLSPYLF